MDPVPDPLLLIKSGSAGDRTQDLCICSHKLWPLDHRGGLPDALISQIYFFNKTLHVSDSSSIHYQEFFTVHTAMVHFIRLTFRPDPARKLYDIYHCCLYSEKFLMMDRGTVRNMQSFIPKNKCEKLVHLVGFIIRIYHDARSPERQISSNSWGFGLHITSKLSVFITKDPLVFFKKKNVFG